MSNVLEASTEYSMIATDAGGVIMMWNEGARRLYGYTPSEILGQPIACLHTREDILAGLIETMMRQALETGKWQGSVERVHKGGSTFTARIVMTPRRGKDGQTVGYLIMGNDITEEVRLALELEKSQAYTRAVLESAPDAMVIVNGEGVIQQANAATEKLFGYQREELKGRHAEMLIPDRHRNRHPGNPAAFFSEPPARPIDAGLELTGRRKGGVEFPIQISLSPFQAEEGLATAAIRDVTERKRFEQDLQDVNLRLEAAARAKDRFLASMSHELRTPLNAILGFTGVLLMGLPGELNDEQTRQLRTVEAGGMHLLSLINDLLDLAKIESGTVELSLESIDCHQLLEEVAVGLRPLADEKGLELLVIAPPDSIAVRSDRRALSQILINLANNAIKFTDEGTVRLELSQSSEPGATVTRLTVIDTGRGIKAGDQAYLFAAFEQIAALSSVPYEGTGLGLYICLKLAHLLGAEITFESEFGSGTSFTLEIVEQVGVVPASILVVEDNEDNATLIDYLLRASGYEPVLADNGRDAIALAAEMRPQVILLDLLMPEMDGYEVVSEIRKIHGLERTLVVAVTASAMIGDRERIAAAGFDGYIQKPIDSRTFVSSVEALMPATPSSAELPG
ncbi:MAG TPA: PAS domain S-box protein [Solirubrobacteraceae bacterium]